MSAWKEKLYMGVEFYIYLQDQCSNPWAMAPTRILYVFKGSLINHILQILDFFLFDRMC